MSDYYVYVHKRATDGTVFYVGKGRNGRADVKDGRNKYWHRTVRKHGYTIDKIIEGVSEVCALSIERALIIYLSNKGEKLVNALVPESASKANTRTREHRRNLAKSHGLDSVYCSNGMVFEALTFAVDFVKSLGYPKAKPSNICAAAKGRKKSVYGFAWSYVGFPDSPEYVGKEACVNSKRKYLKVKRSDGVVFNSCTEACAWAKENGYPKATPSAISVRARKGGSIYGYKWEVIESEG